jgi:hypothetical protein
MIRFVSVAALAAVPLDIPAELSMDASLLAM